MLASMRLNMPALLWETGRTKMLRGALRTHPEQLHFLQMHDMLRPAHAARSQPAGSTAGHASITDGSLCEERPLQNT